jgi:hypothetical protein
MFTPEQTPRAILPPFYLKSFTHPVVKSLLSSQQKASTQHPTPGAQPPDFVHIHRMQSNEQRDTLYPAGGGIPSLSYPPVPVTEPGHSIHREAVNPIRPKGVGAVPKGGDLCPERATHFAIQFFLPYFELLRRSGDRLLLLFFIVPKFPDSGIIRETPLTFFMTLSC